MTRHLCEQGARLLKIERDVEMYHAATRERNEVSERRAAGYSKELARIYGELAKLARRVGAIAEVLGVAK